MLTQKQENYCLKYIEYGNAAAAYKSAYNAQKMKDNTIYRKASELQHNGKIKARIAELRAEAENEALWSREHSIKALAKIAESEETKDSDKISAVRALNLMHGYDKQVIDHRSRDGIAFNMNFRGSVPPNELSEDELDSRIKKLMNDV